MQYIIATVLSFACRSGYSNIKPRTNSHLDLNYIPVTKPSRRQDVPTVQSAAAKPAWGTGGTSARSGAGRSERSASTKAVSHPREHCNIMSNMHSLGGAYLPGAHLPFLLGALMFSSSFWHCKIQWLPHRKWPVEECAEPAEERKICLTLKTAKTCVTCARASPVLPCIQLWAGHLSARSDMSRRCKSAIKNPAWTCTGAVEGWSQQRKGPRNYDAASGEASV